MGSLRRNEDVKTKEWCNSCVNNGNIISLMQNIKNPLLSLLNREIDL